MSLTFDAARHRYRLDGRPVTGVTTLLGKGLPKPALPRWAAKSVAEYVADNDVEHLRAMGRAPMVGALSQVPWQKRDEAAIRGTEVHALAERLVHGVEVQVPDHLLAHVEGYAHFLDAFDVQPLVTERPVASRRWWYAGTLDLIATIDGVTWGLDLKTSRGVYGETALQVAAYVTAEFYLGHDGEDDERDLPPVESMGVIHVTASGSQLHPLGGGEDIEKAASVFRHVAHIAKQVEWIGSRVGEPVPEPAGSKA